MMKWGDRTKNDVRIQNKDEEKNRLIWKDKLHWIAKTIVQWMRLKKYSVDSAVAYMPAYLAFSYQNCDICTGQTNNMRATDHSNEMKCTHKHTHTNQTCIDKMTVNHRKQLNYLFLRFELKFSALHKVKAYS